jgi:hypothetical protein
MSINVIMFPKYIEVGLPVGEINTLLYSLHYNAYVGAS